MKTLIRGLGRSGYLLVLLCNPGFAQEATHPHKYAVAVVSVEELPHLNGAYEVVRRPDRSPVEVIYLKKGAGAGVLSQAVLTVMAARERSGLVPPEKEVLRASPKGMGRQLAGEVPWAGRVVADLEHAQTVHIDGVGWVPAKIIFLPGPGD